MYTNKPTMYRGYNTNYGNYSTYNNTGDDRFFLAPFLFGGLAGTALGYGLANNNQNNYYPVYPVYPIYPTYPVFPTTSNNYYY